MQYISADNVYTLDMKMKCVFIEVVKCASGCDITKVQPLVLPGMFGYENTSKTPGRFL